MGNAKEDKAEKMTHLAWLKRERISVSSHELVAVRARVLTGNNAMSAFVVKGQGHSAGEGEQGLRSRGMPGRC